MSNESQNSEIVPDTNGITQHFGFPENREGAKSQRES